MTDDAHPATAPRVAATLLLVRDDPYEVLMVRRSERASFASALVFPGGVVEPGDSSDGWAPFLDAAARRLEPEERARRIAAIRETWEETGLLLARTATGEFVSPGTALRGAPVLEALEATAGRLALADVHPFGHWVTPAHNPKRWDTHFYVARAPTDQTAHADGSETVATRWVDPAHAQATAVTAREHIIFPTLMNLARLAETTTVLDALDEADRRPHFEVNPEHRTTPEGVHLITIPVEAGYALTEYAVDND
ncbi:hypothetical protein B7R54_12270 [Subtercola boreus]|uniref:Nudix hydrolase domain-containing protein n=1 Tax=Subtercola boreus TaxID=120213 RepID=A0A3E0VJJ4_9MICO|nr:NUDIX hydrolase [Subtercola boreus]RFA09891.1 hypothetical protein B7R54_12270 [Subtercola boreus]TQL52976.1 NUDIX domain-containing protein [Subtercola boreus]